MAVTIDLGRAKLESRSNGLQLMLSSTAQFTSSREGDDDLKARLTQLVLNQTSAIGPWIYRGNGFKLVLALRFDDEPGEHFKKEVSEILACRLKAAKLWQQLRLLPSSVRTFSDSNQVQQIEVSLQYDDNATENSRRQLHKLDIGVPFYDVKPPPGTLQAALDEVNLDIKLGKTNRRPRRGTGKPKRRSSRKTNPIPSAATVTKYSVTPEDVMLETTEPDVWQLEDVEDVSLHHDPHERNWLIESDDESLDQDNGGMLFTDCAEVTSDASNQHTFFSDDAPDAFGNQTATDNSTADAILDLIDAAVRLTISGTPTPKASSITIRQAKKITALSNVAPSLWSPGYLPAVASRSSFLPTIAHAFGTVCSNRSRSAAMRSKRSELDRKFISYTLKCSPDVDCPADDCESDYLFFNGMSVHMWQTMQRHLYDPKAARRLKPLHVTAEDAFEDISLLNELLDKSHRDLLSVDADDIGDYSDEDSFLDDDSEYDDTDLFDDLYLTDDHVHSLPEDLPHCAVEEYADNDEYLAEVRSSQIDVVETLAWQSSTANKNYHTRRTKPSDDELSDDEVMSMGMASVSMHGGDESRLQSFELEDGGFEHDEMLCG